MEESSERHCELIHINGANSPFLNVSALSPFPSAKSTAGLVTCITSCFFYFACSKLIKAIFHLNEHLVCTHPNMKTSGFNEKDSSFCQNYVAM